METLDFEQTCRICISRSPTINLSTKPNNFDVDYYFLLSSCALIQADLNDCLPTKICKICEKVLVVCYNFQNSTKENDAKLRKSLNNFRINSINSVKEEVKIEKNEVVTDENIEDQLEKITNNGITVKKIETNSAKTIPKQNEPKKLKQKDSIVKTNRVKKLYNCEVCGKTFKCIEKLKEHALTHSEEIKFPCNLCEKIYKRKNDLRIHINSCHLGEKKYECKICKKKFARREYLAKHSRVHTGERPYICSTCGKSFRCGSNLLSHKKTHSEVGVFECEICHKKMKQVKNWKDHMNIHTGNKPYLCTVCGKSFAHFSYFCVHKKIHQGIYAYPCEICGLKTICNSDLKKHMKTHGVMDFKKP